MALRLFDGFGYFKTNDARARFSNPVMDDFARFTLAGSQGFGGGGHLHYENNGASTNGKAMLTVSPAPSTIIVGVNVQLLQYPTNFDDGDGLLVLADGDPNTTTNVHLSLQLLKNGRLNVFRGISTEFLGQTQTWLKCFQWHYIEFKAFIDAAVGNFELRVDNVTTLVQSGINTKRAALAQVSVVGLLSFGHFGNCGSECRYDDLYVCDNSGSICSDFLGPVRVYNSLPNGDGGSAQYIPSTGSSNFANVDDTYPDSNQSYNASEVPGDLDTFRHSPISFGSGSILGLSLTPMARSNSVTLAGNQIAPVVISIAGSTSVGDTMPLSTTNLYFPQVWQLNPTNGLPWDLAAVNSSYYGYKTIA